MTHYVNFTTVTNSIASAVTASGVLVLDIDEISEQVTVRETPCFAPVIDTGFVKNLAITRDAAGASAAAFKTVRYDLSYRLYFQKVGANRNISSVYSAFLNTVAAILVNLADNDAMTGLQDMTPVIGAMGVFGDPVLGKCHACDITLRIEQFMEVS